MKTWRERYPKLANLLSTIESAPEGTDTLSLQQLAYGAIAELDHKENTVHLASATKDSPEAHLAEAISRAHMASVGNEVTQTVQCYTGAPGQAAMVFCLATCPDTVAEDLRDELDATMTQVLSEHRVLLKENIA